MTTSKDVKKEPATRINTPDSMALYRNFGTGHHHEPKGDVGAYYPEPKKLFYYASMTDGTTQDFNESFSESESEQTNLMPIEQKQGGFFYNWTYPFHAKTGKHEELSLANQLPIQTHGMH
jgi:hypothetical protein